MTEPYNLLDTPVDDGVRDPFRWSRFAEPAFLTIGTLLLLLLIVAAGRPTPAGQARRAAYDAGGHVVGEAVLLVRAVRGADHGP